MFMYKLHVKETQKCMWHVMITKCILTPNLGFLPQIIYRYALDSTLLELKPEVKVTLTWNQLATRQGPKMYLHTKYGTAAINNIGDLLWVHFFKTWLPRSRSQWLKTVSDIPWPQHISTNWIWGLICHIVWDMLLTLCFACCRWVVLSVNCFCLHTTVMLKVRYINRQSDRGYHYSETNACEQKEKLTSISFSKKLAVV